jgi:SAM-dependent methyltransferase
MTAETLALLACPDCGASFGDEGDPTERLECSSCGARFSVANGVPNLLPTRDRDDRWREWDQKQALGLAEYEQAEEVESEGFADVAAEFASFVGIRGTILDIGCGIGSAPPYVDPSGDAHYVGLDPLNGRIAHNFEFVQGVGEQLPVRDAVCDFVVSATSLDHVVEPERVLSEARRVLRPTGFLALWVAVVDEEAILKRWWRPGFEPKAALREGGVRRLLGGFWYWAVIAPRKRLTTRVRFRLDPDGVIRDLYADRMRFHFHFYRRNEVEDLLRRCGFVVRKQRLIVDRDRGNSLFVLAGPTGDVG